MGLEQSCSRNARKVIQERLPMNAMGSVLNGLTRCVRIKHTPGLECLSVYFNNDTDMGRMLRTCIVAREFSLRPIHDQRLAFNHPVARLECDLGNIVP